MPDSSITMSERSATHRLWRFGAATLDEQSLELTLQGKPVTLERRPLEVLRHLLRHAGSLVRKEELIAACWPGRIPSVTVLSKTIGKLRQALGDQDQQLIQNLYSLGYRFIAPVTAETRSADVAPEILAYGPGTEQRQLSVLHCRLDSLHLLRKTLDHATLHAVLAPLEHCAHHILKRYDAYLAQPLEQGLIAYFGCPSAHEDDAERAVRAAHDLLRNFQQLTQHEPASRRSWWRPSLSVHSGPALATLEQSAVISIRIQGPLLDEATLLSRHAEPASVHISLSTLRLIPGLFITRPLTALAHESEGDASQSLQRFEALQPSGIRTRLEQRSNLSPWVGREQELGLIQHRWKLAQQGRGQVCLITAEPGMGKSRLLLTVRERLGEGAFTWLECRGAQLARETPFDPIIRLLRQGLALQDHDPAGEQLHRLELALDAIGLPRAEATPLLASLLGLPLPSGYRPLQLGPELRREKLLDFLASWLFILAQKQPVVLVFEDLHWCDRATLEHVTRLVERAPTASVLILLTARPEFAPTWPAHAAATINLQPLDTQESTQLLAGLSDALPLPVCEQILSRAAGVPLWLEEIAQSLLESRQAQPVDFPLVTTDAQQGIPTTLQESLMARMDRLGTAKGLLQLCAVIGREIPQRLLAHLHRSQTAANEATANTEPFATTIKPLIDAQLLYRLPSTDDVRYQFKHALIQEAAYATLPQQRRKSLHGDVARLLQSTGQATPELLARHFEQAGLYLESIPWRKQAAEQAVAKTAYLNAIHHVEQALQNLEHLPQGQGRLRLELDLQVTLGNYRTAQLGYGHPQVEAALARAHYLCAAVQDPELLGRALASIWVVRYTRAEYLACQRLSEQLVQIGNSANIRLLEAWGHITLGWASFNLGQPQRALDSMRRAELLNDEATSRAALQAFGHDLQVVIHIGLSWALWPLGEYDQAYAHAQQAISRARTLGLPNVILQAEVMGMTIVCGMSGRSNELGQLAEQGLAVAHEHGLVVWQLTSQRYLGLAQAAAGNISEGLRTFQLAVNTQRERGTLNLQSFTHSLMAEYCLRADAIESAHHMLESASQMVQQHQELFWIPEILRLQGEYQLRCKPAQPDLAAEYFQQALDAARKQGAIALELRAAVRLARLWQSSQPTQACLLLDQVLTRLNAAQAPTAEEHEARTLRTALADTGMEKSRRAKKKPQ